MSQLERVRMESELTEGGATYSENMELQPTKEQIDQMRAEMIVDMHDREASKNNDPLLDEIRKKAEGILNVIGEEQTKRDQELAAIAAGKKTIELAEPAGGASGTIPGRASSERGAHWDTVGVVKHPIPSASKPVGFFRGLFGKK